MSAESASRDNKFFHDVIAKFKRERATIKKRARAHEANHNDVEARTCDAAANTWMRAIQITEHAWEAEKEAAPLRKKPWR